MSIAIRFVAVAVAVASLAGCRPAPAAPAVAPTPVFAPAPVATPQGVPGDGTTALDDIEYATIGDDSADIFQAARGMQEIMLTGTVRIEVVDALIAPAKVDGTFWDGPGKRIDPDALATISTALAGASPYRAAFGAIASVTLDAAAKPDVVGRVDLYVDGHPDHVDLPLRFRDSFTPGWTDAAFSDVDINADLRLRVSLIDRDVSNDDAIGTVELSSSEVRAALNARKSHHVAVADQSNGQILFIGIAVMAQAPRAPAPFDPEAISQ